MIRRSVGTVITTRRSSEPAGVPGRKGTTVPNRSLRAPDEDGPGPLTTTRMYDLCFTRAIRRDRGAPYGRLR